MCYTAGHEPAVRRVRVAGHARAMWVRSLRHRINNRTQHLFPAVLSQSEETSVQICANKSKDSWEGAWESTRQTYTGRSQSSVAGPASGPAVQIRE